MKVLALRFSSEALFRAWDAGFDGPGIGLKSSYFFVLVRTGESARFGRAFWEASGKPVPEMTYMGLVGIGIGCLG